MKEKKNENENENENNKPPNPIKKIRVFAIGNDDRVEYIDINENGSENGCEGMQQSATDNVARGNLGDVLFRGADATSQHLGAIHAAINQNHEETVSRFASVDEKISILKATVEN